MISNERAPARALPRAANDNFVRDHHIHSDHSRYSSAATSQRLVRNTESEEYASRGYRVKWNGKSGDDMETARIRHKITVKTVAVVEKRKGYPIERANDGPSPEWRRRATAVWATLPARESDIVTEKNWQTDTRLLRARDGKRRQVLHVVAKINAAPSAAPIAANDNFTDVDNAEILVAAGPPLLDSYGEFRPNQSELVEAANLACTRTTVWDNGRLVQYGGLKFGPRPDAGGRWGLLKWMSGGVWRQPWLDARPHGASQEKVPSVEFNHHWLDAVLKLGGTPFPETFPYIESRAVWPAPREERSIIIKGVRHDVGRSFLRSMGVSGDIDLGFVRQPAVLPRKRNGDFQDNRQSFLGFRKTTRNGNPGTGKLEWPVDEHVDRKLARERLEQLDDVTLMVLDMACSDANAEDIAMACDYPPGKYAQRKGAFLVNDALDAAELKLAA